MSILTQIRTLVEENGGVWDGWQTTLAPPLGLDGCTIFFFNPKTNHRLCVKLSVYEQERRTESLARKIQEALLQDTKTQAPAPKPVSEPPSGIIVPIESLQKIAHLLKEIVIEFEKIVETKTHE